jgi:hypothetical protein
VASSARSAKAREHRRRVGRSVGDQVGHARALVRVADGRVQRDGLLADFLQLLDLLDRRAQRGGNLGRGGWATELAGEALLLLDVAAEQHLDVDGQADRAGLIGQRAGDEVANPPDGVRREAQAALGLELLHGPEQAQVAFLDEVGQRQAAMEIATGDLHDQAQVRFHEPLAGPAAGCG